MYQPGFTNVVACSGRYSDTCTSPVLVRINSWIHMVVLATISYPFSFLTLVREGMGRPRYPSFIINIMMVPTWFRHICYSHLSKTRGQIWLQAASAHCCGVPSAKEVGCHIVTTGTDLQEVGWAKRNLHEQCTALQVTQVYNITFE